ncbi:MAG: hypothetical protein LBU43_05945, partial [Candidatus Accumulibacter sp.]|nr:hypothetical protein [Accumulibacter sp.]
RRNAPRSSTGWVSQRGIELSRRKQNRLWICGQFACGEPGVLPWKTLRVSHRKPLFAPSSTDNPYLYTKIQKQNIQGGDRAKEAEHMLRLLVSRQGRMMGVPRKGAYLFRTSKTVR